MNYKSLNSYLTSLVILHTKHQEEPLKGQLLTLHNLLWNTMMIVCKKNKIDIKKQFDKTIDSFNMIDGDLDISEITLALHLITNNKMQHKHTKITRLAFDIAKEHRFSKDNEVKNAKALAYKFLVGE